MATLTGFRQDLEVCRSLGDIIDVLKTSALMQFKTFQLKKNSPRWEFREIAQACFNILLAKKYNHPYLFDRKEMPSAIIAVTSDEGFLGELNTVLVNTAAGLIKNPGDELIVLGERGAKYFEDMGLKFTFFPGITEEVGFSEAEKIRDYVLNGYRKQYGRVYVVYPRFISIVSQKVEKVCILPVELQAENTPEIPARLLEEILVEPDYRPVLENLVKLWGAGRIIEIFWTAKLSEYAARIMHLEGSTQELILQKQKLSFSYIRFTHNLKDKSIREISASKILVKRK